MDARRNVLILYNHRAGYMSRTRRVRRLEEALRAGGFRPECVADLEQFGDMAAQSTERGELHTVVAAGGDGTAAEAVNRSPPGTPLATLPLGTENLLSRYLHHPRVPERVAALISDGISVPLDVCRAGNRLFLLMIGVGFDAEVVRRLAVARQGHISRISYAKPLLAALRSYSYPELRVHCGGGCAGSPVDEPIRTRWVFGMNLPIYALGLPFAPDAVGTDSQLDVCTFDRGSILHVVRYFLHLVARRHLRLPDVHLHRCTRMRIESTSDELVPYQLDGDPGGFLPIDVVVEPNRLTAAVSAKRARELRGTIR